MTERNSSMKSSLSFRFSIGGGGREVGGAGADNGNAEGTEGAYRLYCGGKRYGIAVVRVDALSSKPVSVTYRYKPLLSLESSNKGHAALFLDRGRKKGQQYRPLFIIAHSISSPWQILLKGIKANFHVVLHSFCICVFCRTVGSNYRTLGLIP